MYSFLSYNVAQFDQETSLLLFLIAKMWGKVGKWQAKESLGRNGSFWFGGQSRNAFSKFRLSLKFQQAQIVLHLQLEPEVGILLKEKSES